MSIPFITRTEKTTDTWLTPKWIVEELGPWDLDPACPSGGMPYKSANRMIERWEDGMALPWKGRVWLNPPYGSQCGAFMEKMAEHGNGIALVAARTDVKWFHDFVFEKANALFFAKRRIKFERLDGKPAGGGNLASVFAAFGKKNVASLEKFSMEGKFIKINI